MRARILSSWQLVSSSSPCPGQLKSNSPRLMDEAVLALRNLARQCSDSSATEALARHLFAILGGGQALLGVKVAEGWLRGPDGAQCSESACVKNIYVWEFSSW